MVSYDGSIWIGCQVTVACQDVSVLADWPLPSWIIWPTGLHPHESSHGTLISDIPPFMQPLNDAIVKELRPTVRPEDQGQWYALHPYNISNSCNNDMSLWPRSATIYWLRIQSTVIFQRSSISTSSWTGLSEKNIQKLWGGKPFGTKPPRGEIEQRSVS